VHASAEAVPAAVALRTRGSGATVVALLPVTRLPITRLPVTLRTITPRAIHRPAIRTLRTIVTERTIATVARALVTTRTVIAHRPIVAARSLVPHRAIVATRTGFSARFITARFITARLIAPRFVSARFVSARFVTTGFVPSRFVTTRTLVAVRAIFAARLVAARTLVTERALLTARTFVAHRAVVAAGAGVTARLVALGSVVAHRAIVASRTFIAQRAIVATRRGVAERAVLAARTLVTHRAVVTARLFAHGAIVAARASSRTTVTRTARIVATRATALVAMARLVVALERCVRTRAIVGLVAATRLARAFARVRRNGTAAVVTGFEALPRRFAELAARRLGLVFTTRGERGALGATLFRATALAATASAAAASGAIALPLIGLERSATFGAEGRAFLAAFFRFGVNEFALGGLVRVCVVVYVRRFGGTEHLAARRIPAGCVAVMATAASAPAARTIPTAAILATAAFVGDAVGEHLTEFEILGRDRIRQEQRAPIVEVDPLFPGVHRVDGDHDVLDAGAAAGFDRVIRGQREVQEAAATGAQAEAAGAVRVLARNPDEELRRRFGRLTRLHFDRVPVERADLLALDFVALTIPGGHGRLHILLVDGLAQAFVERAHHVVDFGEPELVHLEIELLRLVAEHVGERAGDAFDQCRMGHGHENRRSFQGFGIRRRRRAIDGRRFYRGARVTSNAQREDRSRTGAKGPPCRVHGGCSARAARPEGREDLLSGARLRPGRRRP
jgi:hypothetical protein